MTSASPPRARRQSTAALSLDKPIASHEAPWARSAATTARVATIDPAACAAIRLRSGASAGRRLTQSAATRSHPQATNSTAAPLHAAAGQGRPGTTVPPRDSHCQIREATKTLAAMARATPPQPRAAVAPESAAVSPASATASASSGRNNGGGAAIMGAERPFEFRNGKPNHGR